MRREFVWDYCSCPRLGSGEARSRPLSGRSLDLNRAHQSLAACADGGYQPCLGVLGVPLITVPDSHQCMASGRIELRRNLGRLGGARRWVAHGTRRRLLASWRHDVPMRKMQCFYKGRLAHSSLLYRA
jgi:hypothetical protein